LHIFKQSPQNVAVEPGIHSLASWDRWFAIPQFLYRRRHQSGIFWMPPRICSPFKPLRLYQPLSELQCFICGVTISEKIKSPIRN
jgi:hypothetical protein